MPQCVVLHDNTGGLNVGGFEVSEKPMLVSGRGGYAIISDQRLGEDENLTAIGGIGHRLRVSNEGGSKDCLARDVGFGTKGLAREDWSILEWR